MLGSPLSSGPYPETHSHTSHTPHSGATATHTYTHSHTHSYTPHTAVRKPPPPIQVPAFSFSLSLSVLSLPLSLSPSISPPSLSSLTANQRRGDIIVLQPVRRQHRECVCDGRERERDTHRPFRNINRPSLVSLPDELT